MHWLQRCLMATENTEMSKMLVWTFASTKFQLTRQTCFYSDSWRGGGVKSQELKQHFRSLGTLKLCASDSFWSTLTFFMYIPGPKTAIECPGAEIPQFTTLVSSPALHSIAFQMLDIFVGFWCRLCVLFNMTTNHMYGRTCVGFVFVTVVYIPQQILECYFKVMRQEFKTSLGRLLCHILIFFFFFSLPLRPLYVMMFPVAMYDWHRRCITYR